VPLDELLVALGVEEAAPRGEALLTVWLEPGAWEPPVTLRRHGVVLFVLSGALLRSRRDGAERRVDLLLGGDAIRMNGEDGALYRILPAQPVRVAVVGPHTVKALAGVPGAANALMHALLQQLELELELRAIVGIQRIEHRILAFFGLLARRLGRQQSGGIRIPLALEQKRIEEILSAGHTQATMAFRALFATGVLVHDAAGWRFDPSSRGR
jgi:CRP-like cAMP-binding protein